MNGDTGILVGAGGGAAVDVGGGLDSGTSIVVGLGNGGTGAATGTGTTQQAPVDVRGRIPVWAIFAVIGTIWYYATRDYHYGPYGGRK